MFFFLLKDSFSDKRTNIKITGWFKKIEQEKKKQAVVVLYHQGTTVDSSTTSIFLSNQNVLEKQRFRAFMTRIRKGKKTKFRPWNINQNYGAG